MITLYGKGYSEEDRKGYTNVVYSNVISAIKTLVEKVKVLSPNEVTPADHFVASRDFIETLKPESDEINVEVLAFIIECNDNISVFRWRSISRTFGSKMMASSARSRTAPNSNSPTLHPTFSRE